MSTLSTLTNSARHIARARAFRRLSTSALTGQLVKPVQSYVSTSRDPFLNLSIEHYLLQKSARDSTVLFLYVNRPSIVIGRNQNPWLEVNLQLLKPFRDGSQPKTKPTGLGAVDLVRRRSGGGTVFHDEGNVNWTVISPAAKFTRDKHAEMVVRALRSCGVDRARVNERHDIVLDQGATSPNGAHDSDDTHCTPFTADNPNAPRPLKVSGSAYKLTRDRALHHGTCLLSSPNLDIIPSYLRSLGKPFIKARGVESVSSPVGNVLLRNEEFMSAVQQHFHSMSGVSPDAESTGVGTEQMQIEEVQKGLHELMSTEWIYQQTPQFTFSTRPHSSLEASPTNSLNLGYEEKYGFDLTVRNGVITESHLALPSLTEESIVTIRDRLIGQRLHEISNWQEVLPNNRAQHSESRELAIWLETVLPPVR